MDRQTKISDLIGTWNLINWQSLRNGEFFSYPMGEDVCGQLIYTGEGRMSGFLMRADFGSEAPGSDTQAKKCLSYGGTYSIIGDDVSHQVLFSTIPEWIGSPLVRTLVWQGKRLLLKTEPNRSHDGNDYQNELLWERL
ncbi:MAG: lipocalin-like domain-containing protein [Sneathiella sp.]|nr:lipocalin-like domain-containing protein [Sneathiella sp.]